MRFLLYVLVGLMVAPALVAGALGVRSFRVSDQLTMDVAHREGNEWKYVRHGLFFGRGGMVYYQRTWSAHRGVESRPRANLEMRHFNAAEPLGLFAGKLMRGGRWGFA